MMFFTEFVPFSYEQIEVQLSLSVLKKQRLLEMVSFWTLSLFEVHTGL